MSSFPSFLPISELPANSASRQNAESGTATGLAPAYETRIVVVAQGVQFVTADGQMYDPPTFLRGHHLNLPKIADNTYLYVSDAQLVNYILFITHDRSVFRQALMAENVIVIYAGHAREGQGACFHGDFVPGEWWNDGDAADNGIFRMGYPYIAIPVSDVIERKYHANPVTADNPKPERDATLLHPKLMDNYGKIDSFTLEDLVKKNPDPIVKNDPDAIATLQELLPDGPYWGLVCRGDSGITESHLVMNCGWSNTTTNPNDLAGSPFACRCFCHFGCSTLIHTHRVVRTLLGWKKDGDRNLAYWTDNPSKPFVATQLWLYHLFTYPKESGFLAWEPSINYAVQKTNQQIPAYVPQAPFRII